MDRHSISTTWIDYNVEYHPWPVQSGIQLVLQWASQPENFICWRIDNIGNQHVHQGDPSYAISNMVAQNRYEKCNAHDVYMHQRCGSSMVQAMTTFPQPLSREKMNFVRNSFPKNSLACINVSSFLWWDCSRSTCWAQYQHVVFADLHAGIIHEHLIGICTGWWSHIHVPAGPKSSLYTIYSWSYRRSEQFMHCCRTNEVDRNAHKARGKFSLWCSWSHFSVAENNCRMKKIKFNIISYPTQKIHKVYIKHVYRWLSRVVSSSPSDHQNMFQSNFISEPKVFIQRFQRSNSLTQGQIWQNYTDINIGMFICNGNICLVVVILTRLHTHVISWWYVNTVSGNGMAHVRLQAITRRNNDKALWLLMELLGNRDLMS